MLEVLIAKAWEKGIMMRYKILKRIERQVKHEDPFETKRANTIEIIIVYACIYLIWIE